MLKALELAGFKSFADRTRFDFPDGITVVVGPNGSGKSNIVDAMKWVLGSQSAKSLRGKDMSDVIFKGSQTRGPAGAAEATIIFDNTGGELPVDAPEVHVTRRVYRSGEGEYLINNQAVRLKDIRALIRGTGIGIDAYSLIEQGKVDRMLQANAKDRRAIFEEAAGISRFKAKKVEAERRLARVQQNLTRLGDIVDEVATRLKTLKSQAGKAERYRQASDRLKELRTVVAWTDWLALCDELKSAQQRLTDATAEHTRLEAERESLEEQRQTAEQGLQAIADEARDAERTRGELSGEVARLQGRRESDQTTFVEQRRALASHYRRLRVTRTASGNATADLQKAISDWELAQTQAAEVLAKKQQITADRDRFQSQVHAIADRRDELQREHLASVRRVADHEANRQRVSQQIVEAKRAIAETQRSLEVAQENLCAAQEEYEAANAQVAQLVAEIATSQKHVEIADAKLAETRRVFERRRDEVGSLKIRLQGITERAKVLGELEARHDGVSGGVREILTLPEGPLRSQLVGLVAECFDVDRQVAMLIDAALGPRSQYVIVRGAAIHDAIAAGELQVPSRVGIIRLDELPNRRPGDQIRLDGLAGVIGRADRMVECHADLQPLVRHLLGNTWLVDSITTAMGLRKLSGAGLRFVTASGDLLDNDGSCVLGPPGGESGLISRRSELQAARSEMQHYGFQINEGEKELARLAGEIDEHAAEFGRHEQAQRNWITAHAAAEARSHHVAERLAARQASVDQFSIASREHQQSHDLAKQQDSKLQAAIDEGKSAIDQLEQQRSAIESELSDATAELQAVQSEAMNVSVESARLEQQVESLATAAEVARRDQTQREAAKQELRDAIAHTRSRLAQVEASIVGADDRLAERLIAMEAVDEQLRQFAHRAASQRAVAKSVQAKSQAGAKAATAATEAMASISSARDAAELKRTTLAERIAEDYSIDLRNDEPPEELAEIEDRDEVDAEISKLRTAVQNVGSVNMEALEELNELQVRYDELHGQYQDLTAAKDSLQRVIARINADSRRLFLDTLEAIRQNFQKLYRKSFGGGHADLVLEECDDPLEAGVEIVATPPGKPSFSNSLLSGGEKALTAVALLMSIFQYRPSPFCVLDEVDAPFDEANIGRFVTVLNEFLDQSKFVVVTHSKKTMTAATTLYGVTMQESGVSKQVSIRFEDVSEDGQISAA
ncbi:chromosome segregation protein SMC [Allorhodopirellula heiligendammensis]|uniref:Chromosome partition protein Smc n=1 Tax=Allorhodopirellula heiligendammensis TaxID=2714739 RepID=A0A5C6C1S0_9BACT|nr:chromosome segregation protein SMC [Allorhodopirellula heiligendammensis]TWU18523.1 Chromosome partition protein Smc [Allorhodopirellula heiligendammensis]